MMHYLLEIRMRIECLELDVDDLDFVSGSMMKQISAYHQPRPDTRAGAI